MRVLPKIDSHHLPLLVVRTDYRDDAAWQRVLTALDQFWVFNEDKGDNGRVKEDVLCVDDPAWADATFSDLLAVLTAPEDGTEPTRCRWPVIFLADHATMEGAEPTLLAVSTRPQKTTAPFRIPALSAPHQMHCNLTLANLDFADFARFFGSSDRSPL